MDKNNRRIMLETRLTVMSLRLPSFFQKLLILALALVFMACQGQSTVKNQSDAIDLDYNTAKTEISPEKHANYLSMPLLFEPISDARKQLEAKLNFSIKNRGEAHITVLTPPEFETLKDLVSMDEINEIALKNDIQKSDLQFLCIGTGQKIAGSKTMQTFFIVVKSNNLFKIRSEIEHLYKSRADRSSKSKFNSLHFYPHITLGFTDSDLHEQDGVIKDQTSCRYSLRNSGQ